MNQQKWSLQTRFLHIGLVGTVTAQLLTSLIMSEPDEKGSFLGSLTFDAHELFGLTALGIVVLHWLWSLFSQADGGLSHLFPWRGAARKRVFDDVRLAFKGRFSELSKRGGLSGLVHGLGLLAVTGVAITGGAIFFTYPEIGRPDAVTKGIMEIHEGLAGLVWTYWIAHGGVAVLHHVSGSSVLRNMFSLSSEHDNHNKTKINQVIKSDTLEQH